MLQSLESQNDEQVSVLSGKVAMLKDVSTVFPFLLCLSWCNGHARKRRDKERVEGKKWIRGQLITTSIRVTCADDSPLLTDHDENRR